MPFFDYSIWSSDFQSFDDKIFKLINRISNGRYAGEEVLHFLSELDESYESDFLSMSCVNAINQHVDDDESFGNIPLILAVDHYRKLQAPYRFDISLKVGTGYNHYKSDMDFNVSYVWSENEKVGYYRIEWLSRDFWSDFRAASSVKIRIKQNRDSDYQYYEFSMSGSSKAFNFVTLGHKVVWMDDVAECLIKVFEVMKAKEAQKEAERQKELEALTPPHKLKFECTERVLYLAYPNFWLFPLSDSVTCDTRDKNEFEGSIFEYRYTEYDTILNIMGLCPCIDDQIWELDGNYGSYSKTFQWELDGIHIYHHEKIGEGLSEINVVPFNDISKFDWGERLCAILDYGGTQCVRCNGAYVSDTITKYQVKWTQNPLKLIVSEKNRTKEYSVINWNVVKEWEHGEYRYYRWSYNILSDDDKQYVVEFKREVDEQRALEAGWTLWETNIGQELLFDHWEIPSNIFFRHTDLEEFDDLEVIK